MSECTTWRDSEIYHDSSLPRSNGLFQNMFTFIIEEIIALARDL